MVTSSLWFGFGAAIFLVAVATFVGFGLTRGDWKSPYYFLPPIHALIAGIAYIGMALASLGMLPVAVDVTVFRYADWTLSTPIITYYLAMLAGTRIRTRIAAVAANVLMVLTGYVAAVTTGTGKWIFFALASLFFVGLLYFYLSTFDRAIGENPETSQALFRSLRDLTVSVWSLYPIVFLLGPNGVGLLQVADHDLTIVFLDLTAKVGFMGLMLVRQYQLNTFLSAETTAAAE